MGFRGRARPFPGFRRVRCFHPGTAPHGRPLRYGGYLVEGRIVWGATAAILGQLGAVLGAR